MSIAGNSIREFVISFKSLSVGELKIIGFNATISNCTEQFFSIVESEKEAREVKAEAASSLSSDSMAISNPEHRERTSDISLTVIKQQPTLTLTNILVNNGWLMLLAGEKYKFSIQLTNQSTELINYLSFSFWDSTIDTLNHKLSNLGNNTPASDVYELEWYLLKYKPFRILNKEQIAEQYKKILPQSQLTIEYEITGKKGMKELKMILEYSNKEGNDGVGLFVKYVHVPIQMTITPLIEIIGCELLPLLDSSLKVLQVQEELDGSFSKLVAYLQKLSTLGSLTDYCMLVLDLKNSWTESLLVDLVQDDPEIAGYPINEIIESKKTTRVFIPIKKICSVTSDLQKPIPSLMNKQFIKNYLMSEEEDLEMKQLFWLRESILKKLKGTWATKNKERSGVIDLRSIRLSKKMARTITKPKILFEQVVVTDESGENVPRDGAKYVLEAEEFYTIVTKISNNSVDDFHGIVRYIPSPMETNNINTGIGGYKNQSISIDRKILFNGVLQHGIGVIPKGETVTIKLGITILERGTYEWGTILEELGNGEVIGSEPLILVA